MAKCFLCKNKAEEKIQTVTGKRDICTYCNENMPKRMKKIIRQPMTPRNLKAFYLHAKEHSEDYEFLAKKQKVVGKRYIKGIKKIVGDRG